METKICEQCGELKSIKAFGLSRSRCVVCTSLAYRLRLKLDFLEMYGKICNCCGQSDPRFLTLDHINNDGGEHRKTLSDDVNAVLRIALKNHRPDLYQILCYNCNMGRAANKGICPHKGLPLEEYINNITNISKRLNNKRDSDYSAVEAKAEYDRLRKVKKLVNSLTSEDIALFLIKNRKEEMQ